MAELDGCGAEVLCPDFLETETEHDFSHYRSFFLRISMFFFVLTFPVCSSNALSYYTMHFSGFFVVLQIPQKLNV
jgi:hypothetical protein